MQHCLNSSQEAINLIKKFEGFRSELYYCPAGLPTIGYGHVIKKGDTRKSVTEYEAEQLLVGDVQIVERAIHRYVKVDLFQNQFDALVSFIYNVGTAAFQRSTIRQKINREDHQDAGNEFQRWVYSAGYKLPGLVIRRAEESRLYLRAYVMH